MIWIACSWTSGGLTTQKWWFNQQNYVERVLKSPFPYVFNMFLIFCFFPRFFMVDPLGSTCFSTYVQCVIIFCTIYFLCMSHLLYHICPMHVPYGFNMFPCSHMFCFCLFTIYSNIHFPCFLFLFTHISQMFPYVVPFPSIFLIPSQGKIHGFPCVP